MKTQHIPTALRVEISGESSKTYNELLLRLIMSSFRVRVEEIFLTRQCTLLSYTPFDSLFGTVEIVV